MPRDRGRPPRHPAGQQSFPCSGRWSGASHTDRHSGAGSQGQDLLRAEQVRSWGAGSVSCGVGFPGHVPGVPWHMAMTSCPPPRSALMCPRGSTCARQPHGHCRQDAPYLPLPHTPAPRRPQSSGPLGIGIPPQSKNQDPNSLRMSARLPLLLFYTCYFRRLVVDGKVVKTVQRAPIPQLPFSPAAVFHVGDTGHSYLPVLPRPLAGAHLHFIGFPNLLEF